jgi:Ca2+-binding EF-hand superfamily protein
VVLRTIILASAALAVAAAATAQQQPAAKPVSRADYTAKLDRTFQAVDTNKDGFLSAAEVQAQTAKDVDQVRGAIQARARNAFNQLDTNKDGQLSFAEYAAQLTGIKAKETPQQMIQSLDTNRDGKLSAAEFRASKLAAFDRADLNHDGTVTPDEERAAAQRK